jgi:hypothetical protein
LLTRAGRFVLYRDSGPSLTITRLQQVEHETYLTLRAGQAGAAVSEIIEAGTAGPSKAALLVAMTLSVSLRAFGDHRWLHVLIVIITLAGIIGGVSPPPGGMGMVEAGMILGLTAPASPSPPPPPRCSSSGRSPRTCRPSGAGPSWSGCGRKSTSKPRSTA